jgi:hypothetical protein
MVAKGGRRGILADQAEAFGPRHRAHRQAQGIFGVEHEHAPRRSRPWPSICCLGNVPDDVAEAIGKLRHFIAITPAVSLIGAAVKLRRLVHPFFGLEDNNCDDDLPCARGALAVIDQEIARAALRH